MSALSEGEVGFLPMLEAANIQLLWHPSLSEESSTDVLVLLEAIGEGRQRLDALCIEGAALTGPAGTGRFQMLAGTQWPMMRWIEHLAPQARYLLAIGSCAAFGGIPAGGANPTDARGLHYDEDQKGGLLGEDYRSKAGMPVINIAGCAPHPGWILETLMALALGQFGAEDLDSFGRPRFFADSLAHHGCGRNEFYEYKASAEQLSDRGCLMENLGCMATQAPGDCGLRVWNGGSFCAQSGYPCIRCTTPRFGRTETAVFQTPKIAGIPVGLPSDMPKAWFVALAALSKSATPQRVRQAATQAGAHMPTKAKDPS